MNKVNCLCGAEKLEEKEKCFNCTMRDRIREAIPGITDEQMAKMEVVVHDYMDEAWDAGAWEAANDIGSRI